MNTALESSADEVARLRGCLNDLVGVLALPARWAGGEPDHIVSALLDALLGALRLTFVWARVNDLEGEPPIEMARIAESWQGTTGAPGIAPEIAERIAREITALIHASPYDAPLKWPSHTQLFIRGVNLSVASAPLGLHGEIGVIVAGSQRHDFPVQTERLVLDVAVNQAALAMQQARLSTERRRLAKEFDDRKRVADEALNKARSELAHVARAATVSALTASIAHEVNQPLSGIMTNAATCLRMLAATPPDVEGARETVRRTVRDANRAAEVIARLRALFSKTKLALEPLDLNEATQEVVALSLSDLQRNRVVIQSDLAVDLPLITGDRIQLQQVILNLLRNASEAMVNVDDRPRRLLIRTQREDDDRVRLTVRDAGRGLDLQSVNKLFDAFYTTKADGMGIGLSVSRSIIESHHGRLWAEPNDGPGATFSFSIPRGGGESAPVAALAATPTAAPTAAPTGMPSRDEPHA